MWHTHTGDVWDPGCCAKLGAGVCVVREGNVFKQGMATPCAFHRGKKDLDVVVHGDDVTALCCREQCDWLVSELKKEIELKVLARLGSDSDDDKDVRILNRTVSWTDTGIVYEPHNRHAEIIIKQLGIDGAKLVATSVVREADASARKLSPRNASMYRSMVCA